MYPKKVLNIVSKLKTKDLTRDEVEILCDELKGVVWDYYGKVSKDEYDSLYELFSNVGSLLLKTERLQDFFEKWRDIEQRDKWLPLIDQIEKSAQG